MGIGDCNQLCDFTSCDRTEWLNFECNPNCNSTECAWDGGDCGGRDITCPDLCHDTMLGNGYCELICLDDSELYSECAQYETAVDCTECSVDGAYGCHSTYIIFAIIAGDNKVEAISQDNWCGIDEYWDVLTSVLAIDNIVCSNISSNPKYDLNMNGLIGFWEFIVMFGSNEAVQYHLDSIDCSFCMQNGSNYYL